ncbi:ammonium transporter [Altericroceibacterium spongiae]|nr:ammonium transporter [Altericroceibacterium spongiae]
MAAFPALLAVPSAGFGQSPYLAVNDSGDTAWIMICAVLALVAAVPGLALYYGGQVTRGVFRRLLRQIALLAMVISLLWIVTGYTLAFGFPANGWIGAGNAWMLIQLDALRDGTLVPESSFALFQMGFAILAPALMLGAWAGRARSSWALCFLAIWSLLVYAPVAHWVWGGGWLASFGVMDFAGGLVIHVTAGFSALVTALLMGKSIALREGAVPAPHSPAMTAIGVALLWLGWFGLIGGSALAATDDASTALINMQGAACIAGLTWTVLGRIRKTSDPLIDCASGALSGLVVVSPAAGFISPGAAIVIGLLGALCSYGTAHLVRHRLHIDDRLNVFAVHGTGGVVGVIGTAIFTSDALGGTGLPQGTSIAVMIGWQVLAIGLVALFASFVALLCALMVSLFLPMRMSEEEERILDELE